MFPFYWKCLCKLLQVVYRNRSSSVQSLGHVQLFVTPWTTAHQASLYITKSWSLLKLSPSSRWCHPTISCSSPSPPAFNLSQHQGLFQWVSSLHQVAKVLEFQFQHQSFQWIFRTDFLQDGLVGSPSNQGTLKSLLQHHSSKASILQYSAFFIVQLSHPYMTIEKTIALTRQTFVGKVMSLLFNMLSRLVIILPKMVILVKAMVFPVVMYGCVSWTIKKAERWRIDAFELRVGEDSCESLGLQADPTSPS